jgi:putative transposase
MARLPRLECPSFPHLVIQRVVTGVDLTAHATDRGALTLALVEAARAHDVAVHAYVVLPDHFHLLATPAVAGGLGRFMQAVGRRFVAGFNRRHGREGALWAGRFRATVIDPARYLLDAMVFIETHPWRSGLSEAPQSVLDGCPSSLAQHLQRHTDALVQDHALFWALGNTPFDREAAWRTRLDQGLGAPAVAALSDAAHKGWVLGDERFIQSLVAWRAGQGGAVTEPACADRRLAPSKRGRPRRSDELRVEPVVAVAKGVA